MSDNNNKAYRTVALLIILLFGVIGAIWYFYGDGDFSYQEEKPEVTTDSVSRSSADQPESTDKNMTTDSDLNASEPTVDIRQPRDEQDRKPGGPDASEQVPSMKKEGATQETDAAAGAERTAEMQDNKLKLDAVTEEEEKVVIPARKEGETVIAKEEKERKFRISNLTEREDLDADLNFAEREMDAELFASWSSDYLSEVMVQEEELDSVMLGGHNYPAMPKGDFPLYLKMLANVFSRKYGNYYGETIITLQVTPEGEPTNIKVLTSPYKTSPENLERIIKNAPGWFPSIRNGERTTETVRLIIE